MNGINDRLPWECSTIGEVRQEIDNIDKVVIKMLRERFEYVKEVVRFKEKTPSAIEAADRREEALHDRRVWAEEAGLDPDMIAGLYNRLIKYFIEEEKKIANVI